MHETTTVGEMKRLSGSGTEDAIKVDAPGMEIARQYKYGFNILLGFRPEDSLIRPAAVEQMCIAWLALAPRASRWLSPSQLCF
jgi:hypothetical protein